MKKILIILSLLNFFACNSIAGQKPSLPKKTTTFFWEGASIYFLLTDRFNNGDTSNDFSYNRIQDAAKLRGFQGGDLKGITQKINEGYFTELGINAIWMTPIVEQIHAGTDEGTGKSYGYHGYWTKDWTAIDRNFGNKEDLKELITAAHKRGIRILLDAVINHTGPVTKEDPVWPTDWVRESPQCNYATYKNTVSCTLVKNLPDIKTESNENVALPPQLVEKWKAEGRYVQEKKELDAFFKRTGYPKAPRFYIMKWLTDYITEFGIDGYRVDTVKHTENFVWQEFRKECDHAFNVFKQNNPQKILDNNEFYLVGEVYNYAISHKKSYDFGDKKVNYFDNAFNSLINFELKWNVKQMAEKEVFQKYDSILNNDLKGYGVLNYLTSHDDGQPFDKERKMPYKTATMLLLTPGTAQVYYGDESARDLTIAGTVGDATLRSFMNWDEVKNTDETKKILTHWQKIGQFRSNHMAVGAGKHELISEENGLIFSRVSNKDKVVIGINLPKGKKLIEISSVYKNTDHLFDFYSKKKLIIKEGIVYLDSPYEIVLIEKVKF